MGKPFGKASRRTFIRNSRPLPLTNWNSPKGNSSNHIKNVKTTAFRSPALGRDFKAAHNFTSGADIARYMSNRIKLVQDLISFFVKLNMMVS